MHIHFYKSKTSSENSKTAIQMEAPLRTRQGHPAIDAICPKLTVTLPVKPHVTYQANIKMDLKTGYM